MTPTLGSISINPDGSGTAEIVIVYSEDTVMLSPASAAVKATHVYILRS
jgi:hypothetical protein